MSYKKLFLFFCLIFFLGFVDVVHAQSQNAGFVETSIWYSKDTLNDGDKVKIYTLVFNPDTRKFKGVVAFFDDTTLIGKKDFNIAGTSAQAISVDWTATAGAHKIFAKITEPKFETTPGNYEETYLPNDETGRSTKTVTKKLPDAGVVKDKVDSLVDSATGPVNQATSKLASYVPSFIANPLSTAITTLERVREAGQKTSEEKRNTAQSEIQALKNTYSSSPAEENIDGEVIEDGRAQQSVSLFKSPVLYAQMFLYSALTAIFQYKLLFYGLIVLLLILLTRQILLLVF